VQKALELLLYCSVLQLWKLQEKGPGNIKPRGKNQGIEQVLGKLVKLLATEKDEAPSSSKDAVIHMEPVQKIRVDAK